MKRLLLSVCLVGTAVYLLTPPRVVPEGGSEAISAARTQANHQVRGPLRSSWGSALRSLKRELQVPWPDSQQSAPSQQRAAYGQAPHKEKQVSQPALGAQPAASVDQLSASAIDAPEREVAEWARLTLAARAHSEASVSSPTVQFYSPGTEVQVVGRTNGWFQLLNPTTQERGWVFEKYLVSIDGPSPNQLPIEATIEPPVKVASPKSQKPIRSAKPAVRASDDFKVAKPDRQRGRFARRGDRRRGLGLFGFGDRKAARAAWSIGQAQ